MERLNILLTNGRFPVSLDLARQLHSLGHVVFVVDPMRFHISKFSRVVKKSYFVPAPHVDATGYVEGVRKAVRESNIQLIIPMHEEIFYLTQYEDLKPLLFAPEYHTLISMHNKWEFYELVTAIGCDAPPSILCRSMDDLNKLDLAHKEYALKPVFGRALSGIFHLKPGQPIPDDLKISEDIQYIGQEWIYGKQFCSYAVARDGEIKASAVYPVVDTIDGSSCVYFESIEHRKIKEFMEKFARAYRLNGQVAFDFVETPEKVMVFESNPRATSGIHLFKHTPWLAEAMTLPNTQRHDAPEGAKRQLMPGMLMWEHGDIHGKKRLQHTKRLLRTRDVTFGKSDPFPALMQPFLYITYLQQCRKKNLKLKELFQWDVIWEPTRMELERARDEKLAANDRVAQETSSEIVM